MNIFPYLRRLLALGGCFGVLACAASAEEEKEHPPKEEFITPEAALPSATIKEEQKAPETFIRAAWGKKAAQQQETRCEYLITVANDFIVAAYKNGELIAPAKRELLLDRFGATSERMHIAVQPGDWLVFHVVHNPVRWGGSKYFARGGLPWPGSAELCFRSRISQLERVR
jgi:hypothetical protein